VRLEFRFDDSEARFSDELIVFEEIIYRKTAARLRV
jgi:hypothetical protein